MIRKIMLGVSLIGAAFAGLDCNQIFGLRETALDAPNVDFSGCFSGPITEPAGPGVLTIVFEAPPEATLSLGGCMQGTDPRFDATLAGGVLGFAPDERTKAQISVLPQGRPAFVVSVEGVRPPDNAAVMTVTLVNETGFAFKRAANLPRCAAPPKTCADLAITVPFMPGGAP